MSRFFLTSPGTATLRIGADAPVVTGEQRLFWLTFNFRCSGTGPPPSGARAFADALAAQLQSVFGPLFITDNVFGLYVGFNPDGKYRQYAYDDPIVGFLPKTDLLTWPNGICIKLATSRQDAHGRGRVHWPYLQKSDVTGSRLNSTGKARLAPLLAWYAGSFTVMGVTFKPVVWSRDLGVTNVVQSATFCRNTTYLRKRRVDTLKDYYPITWPYLWPA